MEGKEAIIIAIFCTDNINQLNPLGPFAVAGPWPCAVSEHRTIISGNLCLPNNHFCSGHDL